MNKQLLHLLLLMMAVFSDSLAQTYVQTTTIYQPTTATTVSQTFSSANNLGDLVIVNVTYDNQSRSVSGIADNASPSSNVYTKIASASTNWDGSSYRSELWYTFNIKKAAAGNLKVTVTLNGAPTSYSQIHMSEYSGMATTAPFDQANVGIGTSAAASSGNVTTLYTNELVWGVSISSNGTMTFGGGFNNRLSVLDNVVEDKNVAAKGTYSTTFSAANTPTNNWVAVIATFKSITSLPITLVGFNVTETAENQVKLDWTCETEINNDYFQVQRSQDGTNWQLVEQVKGAGNTAKTTYYTAIDPKPYDGLSYYRLVQVDFDGNQEYFDVDVIELSSPLGRIVKCYPNPTQKWLTIEGDPNELEFVNVVDLLGISFQDRIPKNVASDAALTLDVSALANGIYTVKTKSKSTVFYKQ